MVPTQPAFDDDVVRFINATGTSSVVLVCEHAASFIPASLDDLGLKAEDRQSHAAWDPGALAVATHLSEKLDAKLVAGAVSRLVYDCNRPPEARDAMPERSELIEVPGNVDLTAQARAERVKTYYEPFREAVAGTLSTTAEPILLTVHSFTPVYNGVRRDLDVGFLHDSDSRLADAMLAVASASSLTIRLNEPYGPADGVTHTLKEHAIPNGYPNLMIEIRNDLIATPEQQEQIASQLAGWLETALPHVLPDRSANQGRVAWAG